jgi:ParB/RepB/Spo0J family partition protein
MDVREIPLDKIAADMDFNHRLKYDGLDELGKDIKRNGQLTPVIVLDQGDDTFKLLAGFRRYLAHKEIKAEAISADVRADLTPEQERWINLLENVNRANLSSYEVAVSCKELRDVHGLSADQIGRRMGAAKGYSKSNINNYISALESLHPQILEAWKENHPAISSNKMFKWKALTHDEQLERWEEACGKAPPPQDPAAGGGGEPQAPRQKRRATEAQLTEALAVFKKSDADYAKAVVGALRFALAQTPTLKIGREVIYDPKAQPEEE